MAKFVIAGNIFKEPIKLNNSLAFSFTLKQNNLNSVGPANCPYFAKIEVLAHTMNKVLPDFQFRTMLIVPSEWKVLINDMLTLA